MNSHELNAFVYQTKFKLVKTHPIEKEKIFYGYISKRKLMTAIYKEFRTLKMKKNQLFN